MSLNCTGDGQGSGCDGCYVLKLSASEGADAGSGCTHFTLTRVCQGSNLAEQLWSPWLQPQVDNMPVQEPAIGFGASPA